MPDLETTIRTALHSRADEITARDLRRPTRDTQPPSRRGQWLLAAAAVLLVLAVALPVALLRSHGKDSPQPAGGDGAALFGWSWRVTAITDAQGPIDLPHFTDALSVDFPAGGGHVGGNDGVNYSYGTLHLTADGYVVSDVSTTAAGLAGNAPPAVLRTVAAIDRLFQAPESGDPVAVAARLDGDTLTLSAGDVTVTATRGEPEAPAATSASPTVTSSNDGNAVDPISGSYSPGSSSPGFSGSATP